MIEDDFDIKKKVEEVLDESGFTEQRAAKMGVDELLKYVSSFLPRSCETDRSLFLDCSQPSTMPVSTSHERVLSVPRCHARIPKSTIVYLFVMDSGLHLGNHARLASLSVCPKRRMARPRYLTLPHRLATNPPYASLLCHYALPAFFAR